jgi:hypothetical protein
MGDVLSKFFILLNISYPRGEKMNPEQFYEKIGKNANYVKHIVNELQKQGFSVYAIGSSVSKPFYNDIDLIAQPPVERSVSDSATSLEAALELAVAAGAEVSDLKNETPGYYVNSKIQTRKNVAFSEPLTPTCVSSPIENRKKIKYPHTIIDISISYNPFFGRQDLMNKSVKF